MAFLNRLKYYLIGVAIGSVMVFFMFGSREDIKCSYFPNERVLNELSNKQIVFTDFAKCQFECMNNDSTKLYSILIGGDVDFEKSDTKKTACKTYYISSEKNEKELAALFENCENQVTVMKFESDELSLCNCE